MLQIAGENYFLKIIYLTMKVKHVKNREIKYRNENSLP